MKIFDRQIDSDGNYKIDLQQQFSKTKKVLPSIDSLIDQKQRKTFIKKLFDNRERDYAGLIQRLETVTNWQETYKIVEDELAIRKISPTKGEAVLFTNILYKRFFQ